MKAQIFGGIATPLKLEIESTLTHEDVQRIRQFVSDVEATARFKERRRIFDLLEEKRVMLRSMLGQNWRVIYTVEGAKDIKLSTLEGETNERD